MRRLLERVDSQPAEETGIAPTAASCGASALRRCTPQGRSGATISRASAEAFRSVVAAVFEDEYLGGDVGVEADL
jgi:hypothetical protein